MTAEVQKIDEAARRREEINRLFRVDRTGPPGRLKEKDVAAMQERALELDLAESAVKIEDTAFIRHLRRHLDDRVNAVLDDSDGTNPVDVGLLKAFREIGRWLDGEFDEARRILNV